LAGALLVTVASVYLAKEVIREKRKAEYALQCESSVLSIFSTTPSLDFLTLYLLLPAQKHSQEVPTQRNHITDREP
jgi:hypothetical protein